MKDLMQPRYKVIADYPLSDKYFKIGDILIWVEAERCYYGDNCRLHKETVERYPHIFRKLEWWEERTIDEMPKYVKTEKENGWNKETVDKVKEFYGSDKEFIVLEDDAADTPQLCTEWFTPATEQEYIDYKKQVK